MTGPHHAGRYRVVRDRLVALGNATHGAVCWRDGLTLAQHPPHKDGKPARWTGGHTIDGSTHWTAWWQVTSIPPAGGDWLALEASTCNSANGARRTNRHRANPRSRRWL